MNKLFLWIAALSAFALQSCQKDDGIREEIDSLRDRVAALETKVGDVNASIVAYHQLVTGTKVLVGVQANDKGYVIQMSDGSSYPVIEGEKLDAVVPVLGIDDEGYWTVSVGEGSTPSRIEVDGNPVSARPVVDGEHQTEAVGRTPQLRVSADGTWEVSLDGVTYEPLRQNGEAVNAVGENVTIGYSSVFKKVDYDEASGLLTVELVSGETRTFAVYDNFGLTIVTNNEEESFYLGETRQFEVEQTNVAEAMLQVPAGWKATLEETTLTVTAPPTASASGEPLTLSVVATSKEGYLKIATLKLKLLTDELYANACEAWRNFEAGTAKNVLLDFSYAGYKHGEVAPPDVWGLGYKVYNVLDYGLDPTGRTSSRQAFVALLSSLKLTGQNDQGKNQANASANAIIYFPEGDYVLHNEEDNTPIGADQYTSSDIIIRGGNFALKGAGRDKTRLIMDAENWPSNPANMWTSPVMLNIKHNSGTSLISEVTADAPAGSFSVEVSGTTGVKTGDWVLLKLEDSSPELVAQELAPYAVEGDMEDIKTIHIEDYHQVRSVRGNTVTFYEPLLYAVESKWNWTLNKYNHYENIGVEDLTFVGHAKEQFGHHADWRDDGAYKPLNMMRLTNSWVRRVDFQDVSEALSIVSSANCSAYDIRITGNRGHSAVRSQGSSRVFIGKIIDQTSGYECVTSSGAPGSTFLQNAGQYHASGVSNPALGTVLWNNTWGTDAMFESHSKQPRATLVDRCTGGFVQWRFGGDNKNVPNHLRDLTIWNLQATNTKHDFEGAIFKWWLSNDPWWKTLPPIIVGFHGAQVNFSEEDEQGNRQLEYLESNGQAVEPQSLYEAQLRKRLGYVPGWLNSLK